MIVIYRALSLDCSLNHVAFVLVQKTDLSTGAELVADGLSTSMCLLWNPLNGSIYHCHPLLHSLLTGWAGRRTEEMRGGGEY